MASPEIVAATLLGPLHRRTPPARSIAPTRCSLSVTVERGQIVEDRRQPRRAVHRRLHLRQGPALRSPRLQRRARCCIPPCATGPRAAAIFERVTWDEALDLDRDEDDARRATRIGAESVLPYYYGGSNGLLTNDLEDARFFRRFGASRLARTLCAAPTGAAATAMYGKMAGVAYPDYEHARLIVVWGCNPSASGIHLVSHIKRGAEERRASWSSSIRAGRRSRARPICTCRCGPAPTCRWRWP